MFKDLYCSAVDSVSSASVTSKSSRLNSKLSRIGYSPKALKGIAGCYVFPNDAEDIKAHKWFKGVPWSRLHEISPPFVPNIQSSDDTHYFMDEDEVSDWGDSKTSEPSVEELEFLPPTDTCAGRFVVPAFLPPAENNAGRGNCIDNYLGATSSLQFSNVPGAFALPSPDAKLNIKEEAAKAALFGFHLNIQKWALQVIESPYDFARLRTLDGYIESFVGLSTTERTLLKQFIRAFGRRDRKRPRDRLLRDPVTKRTVLEIRKRTAFLGYTWKRMDPLPPSPGPLLLNRGTSHRRDGWRQPGGGGGSSTRLADGGRVAVSGG